MNKARAFTDVHEDSLRPDSVLPDLFIDNGASGLNTNLSGLGWSGLPANIRQGWNTRSAKTDITLQSKISLPSVTVDASFFDGNIGWVICEDGTIYKINNYHIVEAISFTVSGLGVWSIHLYDIDNGYAVGDDGLILRLINGVWENASSELGLTDFLFGVYLSSQGNGYIVGNGGKIIEIANNTLTNLGQPAGNNRLYDVYLYDDNNGIACGKGGTICELNAGTWSENISASSLSNSIYYSIDVAGSDVFIAGGGSVGVIVSNISGTYTIESTFGSGPVRDIYVLSNTEYYTIGNNGNVFLHKDNSFYPITGVPSNVNGRWIEKSDTNFLFGYSNKASLKVIGLKSGSDNLNRIGWISINENNGTYTPIIYDGVNASYVVCEVLNLKAQSGSNKWIKWFPFVDGVTGEPKSITYNTVSYCGWGIEYQNEDLNGYIQNQRLVLIKDFAYPTNGDDFIDLNANGLIDNLLTLPSVNVSVNKYNSVVINRYGNLAYNYVLNNINDNISYSLPVQKEDIPLTQSVKDIVFGQSWGEGFLGEGGDTSVDGSGFIDNITVRVE